MDNISVSGDCCYATEAVKNILSSLTLNNIKHENIAIFMFEKKWLPENELRMLLNCDAKRILVFGKKNLVAFLDYFNVSNNVSYAFYGNERKKITSILRDFVLNLHGFNYLDGEDLCSVEPLSYAEARVVTLYLEGVPINTISFMLNMSFKAVNHHKLNAMKKMGVPGKADFINARSIAFLGIHSGVLLKPTWTSTVKCRRQTNMYL